MDARRPAHPAGDGDVGVGSHGRSAAHRGPRGLDPAGIRANFSRGLMGRRMARLLSTGPFLLSSLSPSPGAETYKARLMAVSPGQRERGRPDTWSMPSNSQKEKEKTGSGPVQC